MDVPESVLTGLDPEPSSDYEPDHPIPGRSLRQGVHGNGVNAVNREILVGAAVYIPGQQIVINGTGTWCVFFVDQRVTNHVIWLIEDILANRCRVRNIGWRRSILGRLGVVHNLGIIKYDRVIIYFCLRVLDSAMPFNRDVSSGTSGGAFSPPVNLGGV